MERESFAAIDELSGERVRLEPLGKPDLPSVQRWRQDPEVIRYWITRAASSLSELETWLAEKEREGELTLLIRDETGRAIGYASVFNFSHEHRHCEIALMIGERSEWGKGYAREALATLLTHLFAPADQGGPGMHKVSLSVFAENEAAKRVYLACGFREDGVLREDMYYDGRWHDQLLMSVLDYEFAACSRRQR